MKIQTNTKISHFLKRFVGLIKLSFYHIQIILLAYTKSEMHFSEQNVVSKL